MTTTPSSYTNITPVLEKSESPSPGYMSSSPFEQPQTSREHFLFPEVIVDKFSLIFVNKLLLLLKWNE